MPATQHPQFKPRRILTAAALLAILTGCGDVQLTGGEEQVVADFGIAYIKRPIPVEVDDNTGEETLITQNISELLTFNEGGDIYYRDRASPSAAEINATDCITGGLGDVRDLEVSYDGTKILFSLRLEDPNPNDDDTPSWNIYEYDTVAGGCPARIIKFDIDAEEGDDVAPAYLPDGRIVFSSTRQSGTQKILTDEGKAQFAAQDESMNEPAFVLHVMNADGSDIHQISFNQSHDLDPSVLSSGEILFTRWDHMGSRSAMNLYKVRPDGTELKLVYGAHEHTVGTDNTTVQYLNARELDDGRVLTLLKPIRGGVGDSVPALLDIANFADNTQPTWPNQGMLSGPAQSLLLSGDFRTDGSISPAGRFRGISPLPNGNSALVSWSQCRLEEIVDTVTHIIPCPTTIPTDAIEAMPLYGIYLYSLGDQTALPVVIPQEGILVEEPVVAAPRDKPTSLIDKIAGFGLDQALADEDVGLLHIRSVYDVDGGFNALGGTAMDLAAMADLTASDDQRPARFLRILKAASLPSDEVYDFDTSAYGRSSQQRMREILGYAPIQPDGSVLVKVPANVPLAISVVDKDGRRIGARHQNWLQVKPGESLECNGCHNHTTGLPHGHSDAPTSINLGAPTTPWQFPGADATKTAEMGETMAQARIRLACTGKTATLCPQLSPSLNPRYTDDWRATPATELNLTYADVLTSAPLASAPTTPACQTGWNAKCRSIINYETSIHPLWSATRSNAAMEDRTCTTCHNRQDDMAMNRVPAGQVDLSDGPSADEPNHFKSYRELYFPDNNLILQMDGSLTTETVDVVVPVVDGNGDPVFETDPVTGALILDGSGNPIQQTIIVPTPVPAPSPTMSTAGSRFGRFMGLFLPGGSHAGDLSAAEIRLLSEWQDIGGQYFNDPFLAPLN